MFASSARLRPLSVAPLWSRLLLIGALAMQLLWHSVQPTPQAKAEPLFAAPSGSTLRLMALGEPELLSRGLMLWLQAFDYQSGVSVTFQGLDYRHLEDWLTQILALDPLSSYPLLSASRLYAEVKDPEKQRRMIHFLHRSFLQDPPRRWRWVAHAAILAKHRLNDLPLALKLARTLSQSGIEQYDIPHWVTQMEFVILEDMGELEQAVQMVRTLLHSGQIIDANEIHFLMERLEMLERQQQQGGVQKSGEPSYMKKVEQEIMP
ncbi:MAG: hypothetical protein HQL53_11125 [Magnetococcales bacterium]|nr:hypothetical protein [Magnetococcales bacterium]